MKKIITSLLFFVTFTFSSFLKYIFIIMPLCVILDNAIALIPLSLAFTFIEIFVPFLFPIITSILMPWGLYRIYTYPETPVFNYFYIFIFIIWFFEVLIFLVNFIFLTIADTKKYDNTAKATFIDTDKKKAITESHINKKLIILCISILCFAIVSQVISNYIIREKKKAYSAGYSAAMSELDTYKKSVEKEKKADAKILSNYKSKVKSLESEISFWDDSVLCSNSSPRQYHELDCPESNYSLLDINDALNYGYSPCSYCHGQRLVEKYMYEREQR